MVSVAADETTVLNAIANDPFVSIAAVNAPQSIVISGEEAAVDVVAGRLGKSGVKTTTLKVSHAFHSKMMDPILEEFRTELRDIDFKPPKKILISNITGKSWDNKQLLVDYWVDHLRGTVRFSDGITHAKSKKIDIYIQEGGLSSIIIKDDGIGINKNEIEFIIPNIDNIVQISLKYDFCLLYTSPSPRDRG